MTTAEPSNLHVLQSPDELKTLLGADLTKLSVLYFRAEWADICKGCDVKIRELAVQWTNIIFLQIEAEALPDVSESFDVESVPYFILLRGHTLLSKITGAQLELLETTVKNHASSPTNKRYEVLSQTTMLPEAAPTNVDLQTGQKNILQDIGMVDKEETQEEVFERCKRIMKQSDVVLFMKGTPEIPRCGFSQQTVKILRDQNVEFTTYDILQDEGVRQGLKKLNSWPTFPQLIIKGEMVGGLDILKEMVQNGELREMVQA